MCVMGNKIKVSIAMAVYNGEKYMSKQIESILPMLGENDELVISVDDSKDQSLAIAEKFQIKDQRIKVIKHGSATGYQDNFTNAVKACGGEYIFFADQDDIWINDKIKKVMEKFVYNEYDVVITNVALINEKGELLKYLPTPSKNPVRNYVKCTYWGCAMAVKRDFVEKVLPFPNRHYIGHDVFLGIYAGIKGKIGVLDEVCVLHRIHGENNSKNRMRLDKIVENRIFIIIDLIKRILR